MGTVVCEVCMRTIPKDNATVIPAIGFMCPKDTAECVAVPLSERVPPWSTITVERWVAWNPEPSTSGSYPRNRTNAVCLFESFEEAETFRSTVQPTWVTSPVYTEM